MQCDGGQTLQDTIDRPSHGRLVCPNMGAWGAYIKTGLIVKML